MGIFKSMGNFLFPERNICYFCRECIELEDEYICRTCKGLIEFLHREIQLDNPYLEKAYHSLFYNRFIREKVHAYKYQGKSYLYKPFGEILLPTIYEKSLHIEIDAITFVPIHRKKKSQRGYNQSELISKYLAEKLDKPLLQNHLIKIKNTKDQNKLGKIERSTNLRNAFKSINNEDFKGKKILLIDDIITTGATMTELSKVLVKNGAKKVYGLALTSSIKI